MAATAPGEPSSTPKSMVMPTAMKNRPSSRPLKGSMSVSSSRRYSLSASSTPPRNAPSAIDRPSLTISRAIATTSSNAVAVKISGVLLLAIQRSSGRSSRRPPSTTPPTAATVLPRFQAHSPGGCAACRPTAAAPSSGTSARMGMAATSWNNSTANAAWPLAVRPRLRSCKVCSAMAVDDSASPKAPTSAVRQGRPNAQAMANSSAAQPTICALPKPKIGLRMLHRRLGCSSRPTMNSISTTPNSAKRRMSWALLTSPSPQGPIAMPAAR